MKSRTNPLFALIEFLIGTVGSVIKAIPLLQVPAVGDVEILIADEANWIAIPAII